MRPKSTRDLEIGDVWIVELADGSFGACQITDLERSGPGSLKTLVCGVVDWHGPVPPTMEHLASRSILATGLTRIEVFTEGGATVMGNTGATTRDPALTSNFRDFGVGTRTRVWGWRAIPGAVARTLASQ